MASPEALALVTPAIDERELAEEAALAAVMILETIAGSGGNRDPQQAVVAKVLQVAKSQQTRQRAQRTLDSPWSSFDRRPAQFGPTGTDSPARRT
jgi:hypothetical protein